MLGYPIDAEKELDVPDRINWWQRWVLVNSILYYEYDYNIASDKEFDTIAYKLAELMTSNPTIAKNSELWYVFHSFDGSTGFDLVHNLNDKDKDYFMGYASHYMHSHKTRVSSKTKTKSKR